MSALKEQEGGRHYKDFQIQPIEYVHANNLGFCEGTIIKYVSRWKKKNGIEDLRKARHVLDMLIELEEKKRAAAAAADPFPRDTGIPTGYVPRLPTRTFQGESDGTR